MGGRLGGMRLPRIKEPGEGYYHVISRVVDRQRLLDADEKERLRALLHATEGFCGCQAVAYSLLDNHWHVLLHVPCREAVSDEELIRRLGFLYDKTLVQTVAATLTMYRQDGQHEAAEALRARYVRRMYDLSEFAKTFKQRFTQSFNRRHGRKGTLWEERFKSVLVGGSEGALAAVAAYIDLNAVRAGMVQDPKDYRFCGYAEALAGCGHARDGLRKVLCGVGADADWRQVAERYRQLLYVTGEQRGVGEDGKALRPGFSAEQVAEVRAAGGALRLDQLLRCRVRYFTDGVILGTRAFVDEAFVRHRRSFSARRMSGARPMRGGAWGDLCTVRRLRLSVITVPDTG